MFIQLQLLGASSLGETKRLKVHINRQRQADLSRHPPLKLTQTPSFHAQKSWCASKFAKSTSIYHEVSLCSKKNSSIHPHFVKGYNYNTLNNTKKRNRSKLRLLHFGHHTESHEAGRLKREMTNNGSVVCGKKICDRFSLVANVNTFGLKPSQTVLLTYWKKHLRTGGQVVTKSQVGGFSHNSWSTMTLLDSRLFLGSHFLQQCGSWEVIGTSNVGWTVKEDWLRLQGSLFVPPGKSHETNESTQAPNFLSSHSPLYLSIDWSTYHFLVMFVYIIHLRIHPLIYFVCLMMPYSPTCLSIHPSKHPSIHWYIERCKAWMYGVQRRGILYKHIHTALHDLMRQVMPMIPLIILVTLVRTSHHEFFWHGVMRSVSLDIGSRAHIGMHKAYLMMPGAKQNSPTKKRKTE